MFRTPFHADVFLSYSWSVNVCGEKKWILLPPGEEEKLKDKFGNLPYDISFLEESNNNVSDVRYLSVIQKAGEAIFVPSGWHHQVWNLVRKSYLADSSPNENVCGSSSYALTQFEIIGSPRPRSLTKTAVLLIVMYTTALDIIYV